MQRRRKILNYGWANTVVIGSSVNYPSSHFDFESVLTQYRHSLISAVSISAIFDLTQFIILTYFPPL